MLLQISCKDDKNNKKCVNNEKEILRNGVYQHLHDQKKIMHFNENVKCNDMNIQYVQQVFEAYIKKQICKRSSMSLLGIQESQFFNRLKQYRNNNLRFGVSNRKLLDQQQSRMLKEEIQKMKNSITINEFKILFIFHIREYYKRIDKSHWNTQLIKISHPTLKKYYKEFLPIKPTHINVPDTSTYVKKHHHTPVSSESFIPMRGNYRIVQQPADGNCLFYSLIYGINNTCSNIKKYANTLRLEICNFIENNCKSILSGFGNENLEKWIKMETNENISEYVNRMKKSQQWGGSPEIKVFVILKSVNVHIFKKIVIGRTIGITRTTIFNHPEEPNNKQIVSLIYENNNHYNNIHFR